MAGRRGDQPEVNALWVCALLLMTTGEGMAAVPLGARVRVSLRPAQPGEATYFLRQRIIGSLVNLERDKVIISEKQGSPGLSIPIESVMSFEVSRGRKSGAGKGAVIGLLSGAAGGVGAALVVCGGGDCVESSTDYTVFVAGVLGLGGALFGTGVGALVGGRIHSDRWEGVPLEDLRVGLGSSGGRVTCIRLSAAFR